MLANFDRNLRLRQPGHAGFACARPRTLKHVEYNLPSTNLAGGEGEAVRSNIFTDVNVPPTRVRRNRDTTVTASGKRPASNQSTIYGARHRPYVNFTDTYHYWYLRPSSRTGTGSPKEQAVTVTRAITAFNK